MSAVETMPTTWLWIQIAVLAAVTYALRASFVALFSYYRVPDRIGSALRLVPPAVLAALAVPPLVFRNGGYDLAPTNPFLLAGLAAGVVAWRTESLVGTIAAGFAAFFVATYGLGL